MVQMSSNVKRSWHSISHIRPQTNQKVSPFNNVLDILKQYETVYLGPLTGHDQQNTHESPQASFTKSPQAAGCGLSGASPRCRSQFPSGLGAGACFFASSKSRSLGSTRSTRSNLVAAASRGGAQHGGGEIATSERNRITKCR